MKNFIVFLFVVASLSANASEIPTIKVDDPHNQMEFLEGQPGEYYVIKPAMEITLDANGYDFPKSPGKDQNEPNSIQLFIDNEHQYSTPWESGVSKYTLNETTLAPRFNSFTGFKAGDRFIIAIGTLVIDDLKKEQNFKVLWTGMVKVKP